MRSSLLFPSFTLAAGAAVLVAACKTTDEAPPPPPAIDSGADSAAPCPKLARVPTASGGGRYVTRLDETTVEDAVTGATLATTLSTNADDQPFRLIDATVDANDLVLVLLNGAEAATSWSLDAPATDGGLDEVTRGVGTHVTKAVLRDRVLYWNDLATTDGPALGVVMARSLDDGSQRAVGTVDGTILELAVDGQTAYAIAEPDAPGGHSPSTLWALPLAGGSPRSLGTGDALRELKVEGGVAYWLEYGHADGGNVRPWSLRGRALAEDATTILVNGVGSVPTSVAVSAHAVYWVAADSSDPGGSMALRSTPLIGGGSTLVGTRAVDPQSTSPVTVFADGSSWAVWGPLDSPRVVCE